MHRQSGPKDRTDHQIFFGYRNGSQAQGRLDFPFLVLQFLADLVGQYFSDPFQILSETHSVLLYPRIP